MLLWGIVFFALPDKAGVKEVLHFLCGELAIHFVQLFDGGYRLEQAVDIGDICPAIILDPEDFQQHLPVCGARGVIGFHFLHQCQQ